jgi:hypothetical protein
MFYSYTQIRQVFVVHLRLAAVGERQRPALRARVETGQHVSDGLVRGGAGNLGQWAGGIPQGDMVPLGRWHAADPSG